MIPCSQETPVAYNAPVITRGDFFGRGDASFGVVRKKVKNSLITVKQIREVNRELLSPGLFPTSVYNS